MISKLSSLLLGAFADGLVPEGGRDYGAYDDVLKTYNQIDDDNINETEWTEQCKGKYSYESPGVLTFCITFSNFHYFCGYVHAWAFFF